MGVLGVVVDARGCGPVASRSSPAPRPPSCIRDVSAMRIASLSAGCDPVVDPETSVVDPMGGAVGAGSSPAKPGMSSPGCHGA